MPPFFAGDSWDTWRAVVRAMFAERMTAAEIEMFRSVTERASPDVETAGAVQPGLARIPGSMLILISTPHKRSGLLYQRYKDHYGKNDADVLVVRGGTLTFNPTFDAKIIERQIASDPQLYRAEYLSERRDDLSSFIGRDLLEAAVDRGVLVRPPIAHTKYFAFADPSGGSHDSFTLGIAHREKDSSVILDLLFERHAPFNPSEVTAEIAALLKTYSCSHVVGDKYAARWVVEAFAKVGITYRHSDADRSAVYLDCLPLFTSGQVRLIDSPRLISQFAALERRVFPTGRDRVDHGPAGRDDACNAAAGALVLAAKPATRGVAFVLPFVYSKTSGVISDPCPNINAGKTTTQLFYKNFASTYGGLPGSGPREW